MTDAAVRDNPTPQPRKPAVFTHAPGSQPLPGYVIKRGLGEGGFGEVYYALSEAGKEVALKLVRRHLDVELRGVSQCLNLKHPNLVALYDVKLDAEGNHWIVMEYVAGERLSDALTAHPHGLPLESVLAWFRGVAAGVDYLHQNGIVHRDLKPANLFAENGLVKIGDYGLSKFISASRRSGHTESVGTVHYMAPEIAGGRYGKEIDVYSLGVLLCEMLTGRVPFDGESVGEILMKHLTSEPDLSGVAEPYRTAIAAALQKDPARRPTTIGELLRLVDGGAVATIAPLPLGIVAHAPPVASPAPPRPEPAPTLAHAPLQRRAAHPGRWIWTTFATVVLLGLLGSWMVFKGKDGNEVARVSVPSGGSFMVVDGEPSAGHSPSASFAAESTAPQGTWAKLTAFSLAVLAAVAAGFWLMRRMTLSVEGEPPRSRLGHSVAARAPPTLRGFALDVTGSWLLLFAATAVVSRLLLLLYGGSLLLEQYVWTAATMFTATALLALVEKWPGTTPGHPGRRMLFSLVGAATGGVAWLLADYLKVALPTEFGLSGVGIGSWPECYADGRPLWPAFVGYFALTFFLVDWRMQTDSRRRRVWQFSDTAAAVFWAGVVHLVFPFPQLWGIVVVAGSSLALPWAFPTLARTPGRVAE